MSRDAKLGENKNTLFTEFPIPVSYNDNVRVPPASYCFHDYVA